MNAIPKVQIPENQKKIVQQIEALKHLISQDVQEIDKQIHEQALKDLKDALKIGK